MRSRIRKSADYRIFAPARSLSQLVTSFFGSWCQGIRLVLFVTWPRPNYRLYVRSNRFAFLLSPDGWFLLSNKISRFYLALNFSVISTLFKYPHQRLCVGFYYYCFTRSENFLVFSVNQWNCILRSLSEPTKFWKNTLVIYLDFVFVVNLLYTIWYFIQFSRYILFGSYQSNGGLGRTRTSDLTLIRRAL